MFIYCSIHIESFFFFNQNTAYEMRISDWSSDVCSSDLAGDAGARRHRIRMPARLAAHARPAGSRRVRAHRPRLAVRGVRAATAGRSRVRRHARHARAALRVGAMKVCGRNVVLAADGLLGVAVGTAWWPYNYEYVATERDLPPRAEGTRHPPSAP